MRDDRLRLSDILTAIELIRNFTRGKTREDLSQDKMLLSALLHQLYVIGEAASRLSDEIKGKHPGVPWKVIYGFRNHIAHEYFALDLDIVWQTVSQEVPKLESQIKEIISLEFP